jgi:hypothetical protein
VASRPAFLIRAAIKSSASSQLVSLHAPSLRRSRISGFSSRFGLPMIWRDACPRTHRKP